MKGRIIGADDERPLLLIPRPWGSNAIAEMFPIVSIAAFALAFGISAY